MLKYLSLYLSVVASLAFLYTACEREGMPYPYSLTQAEQLLSDRPDRAKRLLDAYYYGGRVYAGLQDTPRALEYFQKAADLAQKQGDASQASEILNELGEIYIDRGQYEEASEYFRRSSDQSEGEALASVYLGLGRLFLHAGRLDSAFFYLHKSMEKGDVYVANRARKYLFYLEDKRSNYKQALAYAEQHILSYDSIKKTIASESARKAQELYNCQKTESENRELKQSNARKKLFIWEWLLVCFFLLAGLFFFVYRLQRKKDLLIRTEKSRRKEKEQQYWQSLEYIEENRQKIAHLSALLEEAEQQKDIAWQASLQTRKALLEITNRQTVEQRKNKEDLEKELTESYIYRKFHIISKGAPIELEEEDWRKLQQVVERTYECFSSHLYTLYPKLSPIELRICYLLKISISVTHIAHLLGRSKSCISIARTRLYRKLFGAPGTSDELDAFIASL